MRKRFQQLIKKLATQFDGKVYGINLPETVVDFDLCDEKVDHYFSTYQAYINATRDAY